MALAAQSILSVAAVVTQQKANIVIDGRHIPLSLFCLSIAQSGDRKTGCDNLAMKPLREWHQKRQFEYRESLEDYNLKLESYNEEVKFIKQKNKGQTADLAAEIGCLDIPVKPKIPDIICQEPTLEGLQKSFYSGRPAQGLFNDEGGQFFGGHAMNLDNCIKTISGLSKFWDGSPITRTRAGESENFTLYDRRLSLHLMAQPVITTKVLSDKVLQQQGILARFLISECTTLAGSRVYQEANVHDSPEYISYFSRISKLLDEPLCMLDDGALDLTSIRLSNEAKQLWIEFYNDVEKAQAVGGDLEIIKPVASKMAENVLRIAGVISLIEGSESITLSTIEGALILGFYYLRQALRIAQRSEVSSKDLYKIEIIEWISKFDGEVNINTIQKKSPRGLSLRKSVKAIRKVFEELVEQGVVEVTDTDARQQPSTWRLK
nr:YfjI family protein [Aestuariicella hydrocarbonica]